MDYTNLLSPEGLEIVRALAPNTEVRVGDFVVLFHGEALLLGQVQSVELHSPGIAQPNTTSAQVCFDEGADGVAEFEYNATTLQWLHSRAKHFGEGFAPRMEPLTAKLKADILARRTVPQLQQRVRDISEQLAKPKSAILLGFVEQMLVAAEEVARDGSALETLYGRTPEERRRHDNSKP